MMQLWWHLSQLKRFGRAHDPAGAHGTVQGELVIECPTCPHPNKNLPADWKDAAPGMK